MAARTASPSYRAATNAAPSAGPLPGPPSVTPADAVAGRAQDDRRTQMLRAALEVLAERGFPETRIADVATQAAVSPALVIYYFKTKNHLLTEAMRYAEDVWYEQGARRMADIGSAAGRLEEIVAMSCLPQRDDVVSWVIWLDLWSTAVRHPQVRILREEFDERWRETIRQIVRAGQASGEFEGVSVEDFAVGFSALLDGFAIQIALEDPLVDARRAFELSMRVAAQQLGFPWDGVRRPAGRRTKSSKRAR